MCLPICSIFRQRINNRAWYLRHSCTQTQKVKKFKVSRDIHIVRFVSCYSVVDPKKYWTGYGGRKNNRYLYLFFITRIKSRGRTEPPRYVSVRPEGVGTGNGNIPVAMHLLQYDRSSIWTRRTGTACPVRNTGQWLVLLKGPGGDAGSISKK